MAYIAANAPAHVKIIANAGLSDRELETLTSIAKGETRVKLARRLCVSHKSICEYRRRAVIKTGLKTNSAIAIQAYKEGYVQ